MRTSLVFLLGLAVSGGVIIAIRLIKRGKEEIASETETHTGEELVHKLDDYMYNQKLFRKNTRYKSEFNITEFGGVPQPDHKTLVKWLNDLAKEQLSGIVEYISKLLKRDLKSNRALNSVSDFYNLLRLLDALVDMELLEELESSGKISLDTARGFRETPSAEIVQMLKELDFNE